MATRLSSKLLILGIDLFTIAASFVLAYFIRFNLSMNFDVSEMMLQLPAVILIALMAFLFTGSYKGEFRHNVVRDVYNICKAICIWAAILIVLIVINSKWVIFPGLRIPLSIILITSLLSSVGLAASPYVFRVLYSSTQ